MSIKLNGNSLNKKNINENVSFQFFPITSIQKPTPKPDKLSRTQPIKIISTNDTNKQINKYSPMNNTMTKYNQSPLNKNSSHAIILQNEDIKKIIDQSENLFKNNESIQAINLLKALTDPSIKINDNGLNIVVFMNLAISYYQIGFLEQAYEEFEILNQKLKKYQKFAKKDQNQLLAIHYLSLRAKTELQICILFSQMGKHDQALNHAKKACKLHYQLVYNIFIELCNKLVKNQQKQEIDKNLINNVKIFEYLHRLIGQLDELFGISDKIVQINQLLDQIRQNVKNYYDMKIDIDLLFNEPECLTPNLDLDWVFTSKILDRIQMKSLSKDNFEDQQLKSIQNKDIVQKITYLLISFYCYSTEIRFIEKLSKQKNQPNENDENQDTKVMDSEHWLSKSLEIAYCFLPSTAPILNQILTVHDRFHGINQQTIPEDKQVMGSFKVLRPLAKPKSIYNLKSTINQPIMIRVQAQKIKKNSFISEEVSEINKQTDEEKHTLQAKGFEDQSIKQAAKTLFLKNDDSNRNNKIRGLGSNAGIKILGFDNQSIIQSKNQRNQKRVKSLREINNLSPRNNITQEDQQKNLGSQIQMNLKLQPFKEEKKIRISKIYNIQGKFKTIEKNQMSDIVKTKKFFLGQPMKRNSKNFDHNITLNLESNRKLLNGDQYRFRPQSYEKLGQLELPKQSIQVSGKNKVEEAPKRRKSLPSRNNYKQKLEKIPLNKQQIKMEEFKLTGKKLEQNYTPSTQYMNLLDQVNKATALENQQDIQTNQQFFSLKNNKIESIKMAYMMPKGQIRTKIPSISSGRSLNDGIKLQMMDIPLSSRTLKPVTQSSRRQKFMNKRRLSHLKILSPEKFQSLD